MTFGTESHNGTATGSSGSCDLVGSLDNPGSRFGWSEPASHVELRHFALGVVQVLPGSHVPHGKARRY